MNLVAVNDKGNAVTSSLKVAAVFGKQHGHVLEVIQTLGCPPELAQSNFRLCFYGVNNRKHPMVEMTRDGFTFLAMGFNGGRAPS